MPHRAIAEIVGLPVFLIANSVAMALCGGLVSQVGLAEHDCQSQVESALRAVRQMRYPEAEQILSSLAREPAVGQQQARCLGILLNVTQVEIEKRVGSSGAEQFVRRALDVLTTFRPADDPLLLRPLQILVSLALESGDITQADEAFRQMSRIRLRTNNDRVILAMTHAFISSSRGRPKEAERDYEDALKLAADDDVESQRLQAGIWNNLAAVYIGERKLPEARAALIRARALTQHEPNEGERERLMVGVLSNLGTVLYRMRDYARAEENLRGAITLEEKQHDRDTGRLTVLLTNLEQVLKKQKRKHEAKQIDDRLQAVLWDANQTVNVNALQRQKRMK